MNQDELMKKIVEQVVAEMMNAAPAETERRGGAAGNGAAAADKVTAKQYPLAENLPERLRTPTGKCFDDLTFDKFRSGEVTADDMRISPETLEMQAQVAESVGRDALAGNMRRAAELIKVPDDRLLEIYNALRPYRSTKQELLDIADELEDRYGCRVNAGFIREAADVYDQRGRLKAE